LDCLNEGEICGVTTIESTNTEHIDYNADADELLQALYPIGICMTGTTCLLDADIVNDGDSAYTMAIDCGEAEVSADDLGLDGCTTAEDCEEGMICATTDIESTDDTHADFDADADSLV